MTSDGAPDPVRRLIHDLRSPLAIIDGFAGLLARPDLSEEKRLDYAARIAEAASEMRSLLDSASPK